MGELDALEKENVDSELGQVFASIRSSCKEKLTVNSEMLSEYSDMLVDAEIREAITVKTPRANSIRMLPCEGSRILTQQMDELSECILTTGVTHDVTIEEKENTNRHTIVYALAVYTPSIYIYIIGHWIR